jgi:GTP cyclohydrolase II
MIPRHIRLTSHPGGSGQGGIPVRWGAPSAELRGPVVASPAQPRHRNAIGSYSGSYAVYRALAVATRALAPDHRPDLELFLPPIGGQTVYLFGDVDRIGRPDAVVACRVHDECNGSDVFGSDICTCRPYLVHGVEVCAETAMRGGVGFVVYNRKEGRALGEVTKFLVYNARKRQRGGDTAETYFQRTECVAGVPDMRFQELMPDVFHWLGVARIDRWVSMSNMKAGALRAQGIEIVKQVAIPDALVPREARVEIAQKKAAGYFAPDGAPGRDELRGTIGRGLNA